MDRSEFYKYLIAKYLKKNSSILILGGTMNEYNIFKDLGFKNITLSNIADIKKTLSSNVKFRIEDMTNLSLNQNTFDYAVTFASIHHTDKPHNSILEMLRISNKGILALESNDSLIMRIATKFNYTEEFELSSVGGRQHSNDGFYGGMNDTGIPNYIYRWNEREIYKLINSYSPSINHKIYFEYNYCFDNNSLSIKRKLIKKLIYNLCKLILLIFFKIFPKQQNLFGFFIDIENSKERFFNYK